MIVFLLAIVSVVYGKFEVHECHHKATWGPQNTLPIIDGHKAGKLINTVTNGKMYEVTTPQNGTATSFLVVHVWGSAYERGVAQGTLLGARLHTFLSTVWSYLEGQVEGAINHEKLSLPKWLVKDIADFGLDAALDLTAEVTRAYTGKYFYDELRGLCEGAAQHGSVTECYNTAVRVHMLAGLTQGACSLFGAWGSAAADDHTLQLRALDWDMKGPFRDHAALTVYHGDGGDTGNSFAIVGFTGFIGGLTGVNSQRMGISEIGVSFPDPSFGEMSRIGYPFIFLLRDILQFDHTLDDATNRMANAKRTCDLILGVGDGKLGEVRAYQYSASVLNEFDDMNMRPVNDTWHFRIPNMVYYGMDWLCPGYSEVLGTQLKRNSGKLTAELAIRDVVSVEMSGNVHIGIHDLSANELFVSYAAPHAVQTDRPEAYARQFTKFNLQTLFSEPKPQT